MEKFKRFMVFYIPHYYPGGGISDCIASFDSLDAAIKCARKSGCHIDHELFDRLEGVLIDFEPNEVTSGKTQERTN